MNSGAVSKALQGTRAIYPNISENSLHKSSVEISLPFSEQLLCQFIINILNQNTFLALDPSFLLAYYKLCEGRHFIIVSLCQED